MESWRRLLLWPLAWAVRLWGHTLRFDLSPEDLRIATWCEEPAAIVIWHNRLFMSAEFYRRFRKGRQCYGVISASRDGAWLGAFLDIFGMRAIRGSSSKLGREAATAMVDVIRAGNDIGITPDGPRGPCYEVKPGALVVTRRTQSPLILLGGDFSSTWRLGSWDRFHIPKPFSRIRLKCEFVPHGQLSGDRDEAARQLQDRLVAINPDRD